MTNLGIQYENGQGVVKNEGEAARWYGKAVSQGHGRAMVFLADLYVRGKGAPQDVEKAKALYAQATEISNPEVVTAAKQRLERLQQQPEGGIDVKTVLGAAAVVAGILVLSEMLSSGDQTGAEEISEDVLPYERQREFEKGICEATGGSGRVFLVLGGNRCGSRDHNGYFAQPLEYTLRYSLVLLPIATYPQSNRLPIGEEVFPCAHALHSAPMTNSRRITLRDGCST
jgi:hypothetical protein